jgi:hypothetical protein
MRTWSSILFLITALAHSTAGQVPSATQTSNAREERRQTYLQLSRGVFAGPQEPPDVLRRVANLPAAQVDGITEQLHNLLVAEIGDVLAGPNPTAQDVVQSLQRLLGETSISEWDAQSSNTPFAEFVELNGARTLAVSYGILRSGGALPNTHSYFEFYAPENGAWQLKTHANLEFDRCTFFISSMDAGSPGRAWFLAWGKVFGDTGSRLRLRLYAFDGTSVKTIWQRDGLSAGLVTVSRKSVSLEYDKEYRSPERMHETLYPSSDGLR